jgi:hypothetical protein
MEVVRSFFYFDIQQNKKFEGGNIRLVIDLFIYVQKRKHQIQK